jgi:hypothetical protein
MGRYYWDKKNTVEDCKSISVFNLKKWGVLENHYYKGSIIWTSNRTGKESRVEYVVDLNDNPHFTLNYKIRNGEDEEWTDINQKYPLVSTPCNYGGKRWWFECSVCKNGSYCGRKVAKLYLSDGKHFACRHCHDLSYDSKNINRRWKALTILLDPEKGLEKFRNKIGFRYRKGKPTKKYLKYIKKVKKFEKDWQTIDI